MEDGQRSTLNLERADIKNGCLTTSLTPMAKIPQTELKNDQIEKIKNGETTPQFNNDNDDSLSSESDALVIDESSSSTACKKRGGRKKLTQQTLKSDEDKSELITHSNPFFNESLFELSQLHQFNESNANKNSGKNKFKQNKKKPKPKLKEYAQYLGLQPTVQFKCVKCHKAGFDTFQHLQEHMLNCTNKEIVQEKPLNSGLKLTRKVFLCSSCGTYYENCNLYLHMLEYHRRHICLYCLGMFPTLDDLCQHIQHKHNIVPGHKNSPDEFFKVYNEPCLVSCCECNKLFCEQDDFFYHHCINGKSNNKQQKKMGRINRISPQNHVTGESEDFSLTLDKEVEEINSKREEEDEEDGEEEVEEKRAEKTGNHEELLTQNGDVQADEKDEQENEIETRKVPKLSLKLPKINLTHENKSDEEDEEDSEDVDDDDSEKLMMDVNNEKNEESEEKLIKSGENEEELEGEKRENDDENVEKKNEENSMDVSIDKNEKEEEEEEENEKSDMLQVAGSDITIIPLELEQPLDKFDIRALLQKCLKTTYPTCIYCNHARKISVNAKHLALHYIAEHRFSAVVNSITAEELIPENFVNYFKRNLEKTEEIFLNLDTSLEGDAVTFQHQFECFQCYFTTNVHKELYLHNRRFHSKNLLLCIMCKSNFYTYSELLCHLCPGLYILDYDLRFKCCMCCVSDVLPSSFRLMVHLRKKHNVCDVCLETCNAQTKLSNHVWKHKLHHFCYRCGIAYRNKPDITRHLFWKHGTESVLCKRCLQKKWPHVYHFCTPPHSFNCDECNLTFSRAVRLKVHKRLHSDEKKHKCDYEGCSEGFISKKLLEKHLKRHYEPEVVENEEVKGGDSGQVEDVEKCEETVEKEEEKVEDKAVNEEEKCEEKSVKPPKIDVLDLPALNLSESDSSSDSEAENSLKNIEKLPESELENKEQVSTEENLKGDQEISVTPNNNDSIVSDDIDSSSCVIQNIWDNFKNYQASKEKLDNLFSENERCEDENNKIGEENKIIEPEIENVPPVDIVLMDHDYCFNPEKSTDSSIIEVKPALTLSDSVDHDYCSPKPQTIGSVDKPTLQNPVEPQQTHEKPLEKSPKKPETSSSSSDTDSSCSCGSNCSCSSSTTTSSSTSDSSNSDSSTEEGRKRQIARRQKRRRDRAKKIKEEKEGLKAEDVVDVVTAANKPQDVMVSNEIHESDLETTESETDEDFYDEAPQKLAKKLLEEKRQQLLATVGQINFPNGSFIESTSRPPTPPGVVEEEPLEERKKSKKSKSKKKKKNKKNLRLKNAEVVENSSDIITPDVPIPPYYQQFHQQLQLPTTAVNVISAQTASISSILQNSAGQVPSEMGKESGGSNGPSDGNVRASKRRRVPNKFYGYSSDEDGDGPKGSVAAKWRKTESSHQRRPSPLTVPPITIKTTPIQQKTPPLPTPTPLQQQTQKTVEPISIRTGAHLSDFRVRRPKPRPSAVPPLKLLQGTKNDDGANSGTDSNDSSSETEGGLGSNKPVQPQLYCYCRCPYDEVSEMIGCDASDCAIEWFHFECVGIMVPPKGQWFCPDCRKKKQEKREMLQQRLNHQGGV